MNNIQFYLIHNGDPIRKEHMINQFKSKNIPLDKVKWILYPNKNDLTEDFINKIVTPIPNNRPLGEISCTYKHYLALKDIAENKYKYAVVMEDNISIINDIPTRLNIYIEELNKNYPDWDILFDQSYMVYDEMKIEKEKYVYPKSNIYKIHCGGGTRMAGFYLLNLDCAKKLYDNFLPFYIVIDWYYNDLFRKLNIKSFWAEPPNVKIWPHKSTCKT
jgi:glycosyl transferase family 25